MICKKCDANIAETSKFCGNCGEKVEVENTVAEPSPVLENSTLEQTNVVDIPTSNIENDSTESTTQNVVEPSNNEIKPKSNKLLMIILIALILVIGIGGITLFALKGTSSNSVTALEKALLNFEEKGKNSGTINAKVEVKSTENASMSFILSTKYAKNGEDYDINVNLAKSALFDEMDAYLKVNEKELKAYVNSKILNMMGLSLENEEEWLYYSMDLEDIKKNIEEDNNSSNELKLSKVLDNTHFKYVDTNNDINHYKLIIDNDLINTLKSKLTESEKKELEENYNIDLNEVELDQAYEVDFYITKSNELVKISVDLGKYMDQEEVESALLELEFSDFNSTTVTIPTEALNSTKDIITYINDNTTYYESVDLDDDYDFDFNLDDDSDFNFDLDI